MFKNNDSIFNNDSLKENKDLKSKITLLNKVILEKQEIIDSLNYELTLVNNDLKLKDITLKDEKEKVTHLINKLSKYEDLITKKDSIIESLNEENKLLSQIVYYNCDYDEINLVDNVPNINENDMVSVKKELDNKKLECDLLNNQISILKKIIDDKNDVINELNNCEK